jgi:DMSO/TMAO reductase YedYZ molybdopterin-dependent catalytic subunit
MDDEVLLSVEGELFKSLRLTWQDFAAMDAEYQIADVSQVDPKRQGGAVTLAGVLALAQPKPSAAYLTLHAAADDFHASIPLSAVLDRGFFIYRLDDAPLSPAAGGPVRFYIRDFAACHVGEVDECANVKFVDRIELSAEKGFDNRPLDDQSHEELHRHDE